MRLNIKDNRTKSDRLADAIGLLVLAAELWLFFSIFGFHVWFLRTYPSNAAWLVVCVVTYLALASWALHIWPNFQGRKGWFLWTAAFGGAGAWLLHSGISDKYGKRSSFIYGGCFSGVAMIGVAGLAREYVSSLRKRRNAEVALPQP